MTHTFPSCHSFLSVAQVEGRQKLLEAKEKEASEEERADMNEDSPREWLS